MTTVEVTNKELYDRKSVRVEVWDRGRCVTITYITDEGKILSDSWTGEHGRHDYEEDFGFQLIY